MENEAELNENITNNNDPDEAIGSTAKEDEVIANDNETRDNITNNDNQEEANGTNQDEEVTSDGKTKQNFSNKNQEEASGSKTKKDEDITEDKFDEDTKNRNIEHSSNDDKFSKKTPLSTKRARTWSLCPHQRLPSWLQDNSFIVTGHRPPLNSFSECFWSIFRIHTETVNIWTHLLGFVVFCVLAIFYYVWVNSPLTLKLGLFPFFLGSILCLGFSFAFHTFYCHSPTMIMFFSRLDYFGISLLILGSFMSWIFYTFYCRFWLMTMYLSSASMMGLSVIFISFLERFSSPEYRAMRALVFSLFGFSGVVPFIHYCALEGWEKAVHFGKPVVMTFLLYGFGALLYALRIPERIYPGRCDIWFQSHQIFHVMVVLATLIDYIGLSYVASQPKYCDF